LLDRDEIDLSASARFVDFAAAPPSAPGPAGMTDDEADEAEFAEE